MNDLQRLNLMMARGAKLDDIITAITSKGGIVESPQKVAEIVSAINDVANWTSTGLKKWATGTVTTTEVYDNPMLENGTYPSVGLARIVVTNLTFTPSLVIAGELTAGAGGKEVVFLLPSTNSWGFTNSRIGLGLVMPNSSSTSFSAYRTDATFKELGNGFLLPVSRTANFRYYAFE